MVISAISGSTPDPYGNIRAANAQRNATAVAARQVQQATDKKVGELTAQAKSNSVLDRQATAAREQTASVQSAAASVLNVYA